MTFSWARSVSELQNICRNGTRDEAIHILLNKPDSFQQSFKGHQLIHEAAEYNNVEVLDLLLSRGADVNACTQSNRTPLIIAASKGYEGIIEKLIDYGADPFKKDASQKTARIIASGHLSIFSKASCVDLLLRYEFRYACLRGMLPELHQLFEEDKEKLLPMIEKGLNFASSYGQLKTVELLITEGARQLSENVSHAAMNGHLLTASYLMMCAQCLALESTAVQNLTLEGRIKEHGVDVDGAFAGDNILSDGPTELFFDKSFDLKVPIKLILEGKGRSNGTDEDTEDCIYHLLLTKHDFNHFSLNWDDLGLPYIADSWLRSLSVMHVVELDLSYNDIGPTLPDSITAMRDLQKFSCNSNALRELPHGLLEMPNLCYVNASSNSLERLFVRGNISQSLKNLNLSKNLLTSLPEQFRDSSIQTLKLSNNQFDSFPGCICGITCMLHLEIDNCKFTDIPNELGRLEELQHLELPRISRLDNIHHELPKTGKILAYLKEKLYSLKPLYEMKLIVVGREGQGKTTLIKRLQKEYTSNKNISTVGIQISKTRLQGSEGTRKPFGVGGRTLVFHTWDFGGQQEYYATHQCFITPATLYILVFSLSSGVSATEELRVWLGNISARAAGSSVLIVGTYLDKVSEAECRTLLKEVSEKIQRWGFGNETNVLIPVITAVSCEPENEFRKTVEKLAESIVREAEKVRYKKKLVLGQLVPNSYLSLIEEINKLKNTYEREHKIRTVVQEEELWEIIRKNPACDDIDSEYQFNAVTDLMHNLGIILHFKEPSLQNQYFLDPCWLCSMMGQIVTIREKNPYITSGILKQHKIRHMLKDKRFPETMFPQYLRILNRFEIALKIDADQILIPSLLPQEEDVTYSIPSDLEYFERQISFKNLPSGFIPRILVSTLSYILSVSNELCSPQFDRERQFSGESIFKSDGVGKAALTRKRSNAMSQSSRHTTISSDRFSEYSFESQTSGTSGTSDQDFRLEVEYTSDLGPTLQDMTPVPDHDIFSKVEAARNLVELSLDMDDILIDDDVNGLNNDKEELKLEENPARYELLTDHYLKIWRRGLSFSHPNLHLFILPLDEEDREGINFVVSRGYMGRRALCHIIDTISMLVEDWYPGLTSGFCENQVLQKIPCSECHSHIFTYDECLQVLADGDVIECPNHPDSLVKLANLIPDIYLSDLERDSLHNYGEIEYKETAESRLGGGAFGSVYRGMLRGQPVAVKTFNSFPMKPEAPYLELRREVNILKKMDNVCIVKMLAVSLRPTQCLVIEFAPCHDLEHQLSSQDSLPRLFLYKAVHQTACALAYLHKHTVIYRDIKPANILVFSMEVGVTPNVKLSDYGIAGTVGSGGVKGFHGTPGFQAPEMLVYHGLEEYTEAVDVYSFAFLLYEGICRKKAYTGMHRFDINKSVVANIRPAGYKSIRMTRFGMRNLKKLMEECWAQDPLKRPKMKDVGKMLSHIGYQMFLGHTMPPNAISARATCTVYSQLTQTIWVGSSEARTCKIMLMKGSTLDVAMLHDGDLELGCTLIRDIVEYKDKIVVLATSKHSTKLFRFCNEEEPELESMSECLSFGSGHQHVQNCLASTNDFIFVGHCHGFVTRTILYELQEVDKQFKLPTNDEVVKILENRSRNLGCTESTEQNATGIKRLMNMSKVDELAVVELIIMTRFELFVVSSDFKSIKRYTFTQGLDEDVCAVISRDKVFSTTVNSTYIQMFNLKKERASKFGIDLRSDQIQLSVDCRDIKCTCLAATKEVLWVGTNHGAVLLFSTRKKHSFLTYIRPCVREIQTILPYMPKDNLLGEAVSTIETELARKSCPEPARSSRPQQLIHSMSFNSPVRHIDNRHDLYNSNYQAGVFVCVCGMGRFSEASHLLSDTPLTEQGDYPDGMFAVVLEEPPVEHIMSCNRIYQAGGLL